MKKLRQPKAGDIWLCNEGAVFVTGVLGDYVDYLWQNTPNNFELDSRSVKNWNKHFSYKENIFDCEWLKDKLPQEYQEIKELQQQFEDATKQKIMHDPINHPSHYISHPSGIECITITEHHNFCIGNAIKYLWRAGLKDGNSTIQDLQKAVWYINKEIERLKK